MDARKNYDSSDEEEGNMMMLKNYYSHQSLQRKQQRQHLDSKISGLIKHVDQSSHKLLRNYRPKSAFEDKLIEPMRKDMQMVLQKGVVNIHDKIDHHAQQSSKESSNIVTSKDNQNKFTDLGAASGVNNMKSSVSQRQMGGSNKNIVNGVRWSQNGVSGSKTGTNSIGERRRQLIVAKKDEKIKRCNTFIDTLQSKQAYFKYKTGKLSLPGKRPENKTKNNLDKYEAIKKLVQEKIEQHTQAAQPVSQPRLIFNGKKLKYSERKQQIKGQRRMSQTQMVSHKQSEANGESTSHNSSTNSQSNSNYGQQHFSNPNLIHTLSQAEDKQLQELKRQMATLSLKNRQFYKQVNMDMHNAQRDRLKEMQRDLVRMDKKHLREQLTTLKRVQSMCNNSKKQKEVMAYMQSTLKETSFDMDEEGNTKGRDYTTDDGSKKVKANMKKVFEEAKELLERQIREEKKEMMKQKQQQNNTNQNAQLNYQRPQSAALTSRINQQQQLQRSQTSILNQDLKSQNSPINSRPQSPAFQVFQANKQQFLCSLQAKKMRKSQKTLKQVMIMTGDLIELERAKERDFEKFVNHEYNKDDVIRSTPSMSLHQIKRPMTGRVIKPRQKSNFQFISSTNKSIQNSPSKENQLSDQGLQTLKQAEQIIEFAKPKYDQIRFGSAKSRYDQLSQQLMCGAQENFQDANSNSRNGGIYVSVSQKKTVSQQIRESLLVSPKKMFKEEQQKQLMQQSTDLANSISKQNNNNVQYFSVNNTNIQSRPQTARIDSFLQTSRIFNQSALQKQQLPMRRMSSRGNFVQVPLLSNYLSTANVIHANKQGLKLIQCLSQTDFGTGLDTDTQPQTKGDIQLMINQFQVNSQKNDKQMSQQNAIQRGLIGAERRTTTNLLRGFSAKSRNQNHLLIGGGTFKTQALSRYDEEFDTRYLDPRPQVNLVKVDQDLKSLMQTIQQQKTKSQTQTQRMTKTILSNMTEIERANQKQLEAKQKYEEWKRNKSFNSNSNKNNNQQAYAN